jgi:hypothetical protein
MIFWHCSTRASLLHSLTAQEYELMKQLGIIRFRFGLRAVAIVTLLAALALGPVRFYHQANRQELAVGIIDASGGEVLYAHEFDERGVYNPHSAEPGPGWLKAVVGRHAFLTPVEVRLSQVVRLNPSFDLAILADLKTLRRAELYCWKPNDIDSIGKLRLLEVLRIDHSKSSLDFTPLGKLTKLRSLSLEIDGMWHAAETFDLSFVSPLRQLESFQLEFCRTSPVLDLSPLSSLENLTSFEVGRVTDVSPLSASHRLTHLSVSLAPEDTTLHGLAQLKNLQVLSLNNSQIAGLSEIGELRNLEQLDLSPYVFKWGTTYDSMCYASDVDSIQFLQTDITPLLKLKKLKKLNLTNRAFDTRLLGKMTSLEEMTISAGNGVDLSQLDRPPALRHLKVHKRLSQKLDVNETHWLASGNRDIFDNELNFFFQPAAAQTQTAN